MEKSIVSTGKTIEDAIASGLAVLGLDRDNVSVEVLETPKSGFLGLGTTPAKVSLSYSVSKVQNAEEFLHQLFSRMGISVSINVKETSEGLKVDLSNDDNAGSLIGRRGETLDAIQHITSQVVNKDESETVRVVVDVGGYRQKRDDTLLSMAKRMAEKAKQTRRSMSLEPMNAYERHVIHVALQDDPDVTTRSTDVEPNRRVVIVPANEIPSARPPIRPAQPRQQNSSRGFRGHNK